MGDLIKALPIDKNPQDNQDEIILAANLFGVDQIPNVISHFKPALLATLIFFILSLPFIDKLLLSFSKRYSSPYALLVIKGVIFFVTLYFLSNLYLVKN